MVIQVNGKVRDRMVVPVGMAEDEVRSAALESDRIKQWIEGAEIKRIVVVPDKLINIVVN